MTRFARDTLAYLFVVGFCVLMLVWAIPTYTPPYPGYGASPDLVPVVAVYLMLAMACLSLLRMALAHWYAKPLPPEEREFPEDLGDAAGFTQVGRVSLANLVGIMLPSFLLVWAIDYVGYAIASLVFLFVLQYIIGCRRIVQASIVSVALVVVLYVVMRYGFGVPVPGPQVF